MPLPAFLHLAVLTTLAASLAALDQLPPGPRDALTYEVGWIGNTLPGAKGHVPQDVDALCVAPDGRIFTNVHWEEGGGNCTAIKDGVVLAKAEHTHGWGHEGGWAVAANRRHLFISGRMDNEGGGLKGEDTWPPKGSFWHGVSRRSIGDIRKAAPFPEAKGGRGGTLTQAFAVVDQIAHDAQKRKESRRGDIAALAATDSRLYVACPYDGTIKVLDAESMARVAVWQVTDVLGLALDRDGSLWALQKPVAGATRLLHLDATTGTTLPAAAMPVTGMDAVALCCAPDGALWVADDGERQQVAVYADPRRDVQPSRWLGVRGGIHAEPAGRVGDGRFNRPGAIASDAQGNLIIAQRGSTGGGSTVLECYRGEKTTWRLLGIHFVDMADVDPADDREVFTKEERIRLAADGKGWDYAGYTVDRFRHPEDPRLHLWSAGAWVRRIAGLRILFVLDMNSERIQVYRFAAPPAETAIPAGVISPRPVKGGAWPPEQAVAGGTWPPHQPASGGWWWHDADGDGRFAANEYAAFDLPACQGWWVDGAGTVWAATETKGIRAIPYAGLTTQGVPRWDLAKTMSFPMPEDFRQVKRLRYDDATDTMYLGGTTAKHGNQHWKPMGPVLARYDRWSKPDRSRRWLVCLPYASGSKGHESCEPMGFDVAGDHVFVPYTGAAKSMRFSTGHIEVLRAADGQPVGSMEPSPAIGEIGLQDVRDCLRAWRCADGSYRVFLEEDYKAKILMYRWKP